MTRTIISMLVVVLGLALMALSSCQSREEESEGTVGQYDNSHEETTPSEHIQYPNEYIQYSNEHSVVQSSNKHLPDTGGISLADH